MLLAVVIYRIHTIECRLQFYAHTRKKAKSQINIILNVYVRPIICLQLFCGTTDVVFLTK